MGAGACSWYGPEQSDTGDACPELTVTSSEGFTLPERFPFSLNPPVAMKPEKNHELPSPADWLVLVLFGFLTGENDSACHQKAPGLSAPFDHQFPVAAFCFSLFPFVEAFRAWVHICESVWMFPTTGTLLCVSSLLFFFLKGGPERCRDQDLVRTSTSRIVTLAAGLRELSGPQINLHKSAFTL